MPSKSSKQETAPTRRSDALVARLRRQERDSFTAMMDSAIEADLGDDSTDHGEPAEAAKRTGPSGSAVAVLLAAGWSPHINDAMLTAGQEIVALVAAVA